MSLESWYDRQVTCCCFLSTLRRLPVRLREPLRVNLRCFLTWYLMLCSHWYDRCSWCFGVVTLTCHLQWIWSVVTRFAGLWILLSYLSYLNKPYPTPILQPANTLLCPCICLILEVYQFEIKLFQSSFGCMFLYVTTPNQSTHWSGHWLEFRRQWMEEVKLECAKIKLLSRINLSLKYLTHLYPVK